MFQDHSRSHGRLDSCAQALLALRGPPLPMEWSDDSSDADTWLQLSWLEKWFIHAQTHSWHLLPWIIRSMWKAHDYECMVHAHLSAVSLTKESNWSSMSSMTMTSTEAEAEDCIIALFEDLTWGYDDYLKSH